MKTAETEHRLPTPPYSKIPWDADGTILLKVVIMLKGKTVRITVLKKTFNQEFVDAYASEDAHWAPQGCCHDFDVGQQFFSDGHMPEGFSDWAWTDIQKYVVVLARGGNMLGAKEGKFVTCCTDGFRPVFYLLERIEEGEGHETSD